MERINKVIANSGYSSRRKAEELIVEGKVYVNGEKAQLGQKVNATDLITIDGKPIDYMKGNYEYYLLNKPRGVVTTSKDDKGRKTVIDLIETEKRIYPIGRLDYDTTGVLLLTNDGELTNKLTHPKNNIDKVYVAKIAGIIAIEDIKRLRNGVKIDNYVTSKAKVKVKSIDKKKNNSIIEITIHEGHNHQVKRMFQSVGYDVEKLTRISFAGLNIGKLKSGEYRKLTVKEVNRLYSL